MLLYRSSVQFPRRDGNATGGTTLNAGMSNVCRKWWPVPEVRPVKPGTDPEVYMDCRPLSGENRPPRTGGLKPAPKGVWL
jgi:hypothetical protein